MQVWIDADACPNAIKGIIEKTALNRQIVTTFVANKRIELPSSPYLKSMQVAMGMDVADAQIVEMVEAGDLVVTEDVPLAAALVPKGAHVITPHGQIFTESNIRQKLSARDHAHMLREVGVLTSGPAPFNNQDKQAFANAYDRLVTKYHV